MRIFDCPLQSSFHANNGWWKFIWALNIPPKVKFFFWRACLDLLPTEFNFEVHHVPINGCSLCKVEWGSTSHTLFFCPVLNKFGKRKLFQNSLWRCRSESFIVVFYSFRQIMNKNEYEIFVTSTWALWKEICKLKHHHGKGYSSTKY